MHLLNIACISFRLGFSKSVSRKPGQCATLEYPGSVASANASHLACCH